MLCACDIVASSNSSDNCSARPGPRVRPAPTSTDAVSGPESKGSAMKETCSRGIRSLAEAVTTTHPARLVT